MKIVYNGYLYEALNSKEAYDFASYLADPIVDFIQLFKNTMVTGGRTLLPEFEKYNVHNKFEIPFDEVLKKKMFTKKGEVRNELFKSIINKGYVLILDYKDLEKFNGTSKCANTTNGKDPRTVKHYIEISSLWRSLAEIQRTVEHELVHVYHCDKTIGEYIKSFQKLHMYDIDAEHEVAANFKGIAKAIERSITETYIKPIVRLRSNIVKYNNRVEVEESIEQLKSELFQLKLGYQSIARSQSTFVDYVRDSWSYLTKHYPQLIEELVASRYEERFDLIDPYIRELYNNLKQRGFFEISLNAIEGLTE